MSRKTSGLKSWTNLIAEDRLSEIFEELGHTFTDLDVISRLRQPLLFRKRQQFFLDRIELAERR